MFAALIFGKSAAEDLREFTATWSGEAFGNDAIATARIILDMDLVINPGTTYGESDEDGFVSDFSITVVGAATGNGTWSMSDIGRFRLSTRSDALDFRKELVGQNGWGIDSNEGSDFEVSYVTNGAPRSINFFNLGTDSGHGDPMRLTSFMPAASIPLILKREFGLDYGTGVDERVYAIAEDSQERLVVGGLFTQADGYPSRGIARFRKSGELDDYFQINEGVNGGIHSYVTSLVILPDDSMVAVGDFTEYDLTDRGRIVRILPEGGVDEDFANGIGADAIIRCIELLPDGKFLIGGAFTEYDGVPRSRIARLDENGNLDTTFDPDDEFGDSTDYVDEIEVLEDGSFLAAGRFEEYGGHATRNVVRVFTNGSVDESFGTPDNPGDYVEAMAVLSDGKIVLGSSNAGQIIYRLNEDGTRDLPFDPDIQGSGVYGLMELPDGRVMVSGLFESSAGDGFTNLIILKAGGSVDEDGFYDEITPDGWVGPLLKSSDGSIYAGGAFSTINGEERGHLARFGNYSPDVRFASATGTITEGEYTEFEISVNSDLADVAEFTVTVEADDPELLPLIGVQSRFTAFPEQTTDSISVRFSGDSTINSPRNFRLRLSPLSPGATVGVPDVMDITVEDDDIAGTVFLESSTFVINEGRGSLPVKVRRYLDDPGALSVKLRTVAGTAVAGRDYQAVNTTVNFPAGVYEQIINIEGPLSTADANPLRQFRIELYEPSATGVLGSIHAAAIDVNDKDDDGSSIVDYTVPDPELFFRCDDLALAPDGRLYAVATYLTNSSQRFESRLLHFNSLGEGQSITIPNDGPRRPRANCIKLGYDGKVYVAGIGSVYRFLPGGTIDSSWTNPIAYDASLPTTIQNLLPLPDGKTLICGRITDPIGGISRQQVAKLMPDGAIDESFNLGAILPLTSNSWIYDMALERSGKILLAGNFTSVQGKSRRFVVRVFPDGTLDEGFDASAAISSVATSSYVSRIVASPDGKIYLGVDDRIIRVASDGTLDPGFSQVEGIDFALQPDGKVVVGIRASRSGGKRVNSSGLIDGDFIPYFPPLGLNKGIEDVEIGSDGRIHFAGSFTSFDGVPASGIATVRGGPGANAGKLVWETDIMSVGEGIGTQVTKLQRIDSTVGNVGIHYTLVGETAELGTDVEVFSGYHEFTSGETEHEVGFKVLDDSILEGVESFRFVLHDPSGGVQPRDSGGLRVDIIDDDGSDLASWISRYQPANPLDLTTLNDDPDGDGVRNFVEWMTDSDPTRSSDAKRPVPGYYEIMTGGSAESRFGISFYYNPDKPGFRTVVEQSGSLKQDSWSILWDSDADPLLESELISSDPSKGLGWMSVRSPDPMTNREFLRVRYEAK